MLSTLILDKPNITDFAKERNGLLKKAKTEWVLFLDSDEIVTDELQKEISNAILDKNYNGYYIKRKIIFCGTSAGEDKMLKLARKNSGVWKRKVHEFWDVQGKIGVLNNYIVHNTANNLTSYINKIDYYSTLHAESILKEGKTSNLFKIVFFPIAKFFVTIYQFKNVVFSIMQSLHSYLAWSKLYFLQH